ncbi:MAG: glycerophosphodiester phosphodiesterase [Pseudomonadota bacterium]
MLVLAHRGHHAEAAENSLAAFAAAVACGADGIETDVHLSRDGVPVLVHDRVVGGRAVTGMTRAGLEAALGRTVATLPEALEQFPDALWNVEIKHPEALPAMLEVLRHYLDSRRLLVTSFRHDTVLACARALPVTCGLLCAERPLQLEALLAPCAGQPNLRTLVWDYNILDDKLVGEATALGWRNIVYGAHTRDEHLYCKRLGLEAVITDHPELAKAI